jgi:site-specific DNA-cytosine methylase
MQHESSGDYIFVTCNASEPQKNDNRKGNQQFFCTFQPNLTDNKMSLKQTISINEFDGKSYQIRLVEGIEEKAVLTHYLHNYRNGVKKHYEKDAISTLKNFVEYKQIETANMGSGGHNVPLIKDDFGIRKLTPKECFAFQGYPIEKYILPKLANSKLYMQAGNSVTTTLVERIANQIIKVL